MAAPKGHKKYGGGRAKGTPNKMTAAVKDAIVNAFNKVGGETYLVKVAREDPRTFCTLLGKVMPLQITGDGEGGGLTVNIIRHGDQPPE